MPNQKGFAPLLLILTVVLVLIGGFAFYSWLHRPFTLSEPYLGPAPKFSVDNKTISHPNVSVVLDSAVALNKLKKGDKFMVLVQVSASEPVNLLSTKLSYPKDLVAFKQFVEVPEAEAIMWMSQKDLQDKGMFELVGGIPDPGLALSADKRTVVGKLEFEVIGSVADGFVITPTESKLYSNQTNQELEGLNEESSAIAKQVLGTESGGSFILGPATVTTAPGCTFILDVYYDTNENPIKGLDIVLLSDPTKVKAIEAVSTGATLYGVINSDGSEVRKSVIDTGGSFPSRGVMAKVKYKVLDDAADGNLKVSIKFDPNYMQNTTDSNIVYTTTKDILTKVSGTYVLIAKGNKCDSANSVSTASTSTTTNTSGTTTVTQKPKPLNISTVSAIQITDSEGDTSRDGKVTLADMSVLLSRFNRVQTASGSGDLNKDGKVNVLDYSIMVKYLIKKKILSL